MSELTFGVSDFVAVFNQSINYAYPSVTIVGELANFRVSKNRWVYFDLKDETASVKFFGSVQQLQDPLEEGMVLTVHGTPQLHPLYGFSINIIDIRLTGEGTIKRAAQILEAKLRAEGLFDEARKRLIPFPPQTVGLITSSESAAYADFIKILNERWGGVDVQLYDVQVQGEQAPKQIVAAINYFNKLHNPPEVLVVTRGGGSPDDLQAFSNELVVRAVAASAVPTLVAVGHEIDVSLAELAADYRASTPSNAAQVLVPNRSDVLNLLLARNKELQQALLNLLKEERFEVREKLQAIHTGLVQEINYQKQHLSSTKQLLELLHPDAILKRGYAVVRQSGKVVKSVKQVKEGVELSVQVTDGSFTAIAKGKVK